MLNKAEGELRCGLHGRIGRDIAAKLWPSGIVALIVVILPTQGFEGLEFSEIG